jgi:hypothetical protein
MSLITEVAQLQPRLLASESINKSLPIFFRIPTATFWNRLEGRPRSDDLNKALRADVRDPLWMLSRQWQFGEFKGEDAGMPVRAKVLVESSPISSIGFKDDPRQPYNPDQPLEYVVEHHEIEPNLMMSLYLGHIWIIQLEEILKEINTVDKTFIEDFKKTNTYGIQEFGNTSPIENSTVWVEPSKDVADEKKPELPKDLDTLIESTQLEALQTRHAVAGRSIDGIKLLIDISNALKGNKSPSDRFKNQGVSIPGSVTSNVDKLAKQFNEKWFEKFFAPRLENQNAWKPEHLEHSFSLGIFEDAKTETTLLADQYPGGHLDWYAFDVVKDDKKVNTGSSLAKTIYKKTFVPTPIRFPGMPNVRWWEFEDNRVGFGLTTATKTDLAKLLLAEFGLVYSNDWFILPFRGDVGTLIETKGIVVTDNFGMNTLIEPTAKRHTEKGLEGVWGMWNLNIRDDSNNLDTRFFLAPSLGRSLESKAVEEVVFLRDEVANLVWGVEAVIPNPVTGGLDARYAGKLLREAITKAYPETIKDGADDVLLHYQLMGSVPENWIPFVSVKLQGESASSAFLQGAMPRIPPLDTKTGATDFQRLASKVVLPRGSILSKDPVTEPNIVFEEEFLRSGAVVKKTFQQARWHNGTTFNWNGRKKMNGRGEGSSGLVFDVVNDEK